jgi:hypothetical protein
MIGALAEVAGLEGGVPELALGYLQDYDLLAQAVERWPEEARQCSRRAVRVLIEGRPRADVVSAIAIEQDEGVQADQARIDRMEAEYGDYARQFSRLRKSWRETGTPLHEQHRALMELAGPLRKGRHDG